MLRGAFNRGGLSQRGVRALLRVGLLKGQKEVGGERAVEEKEG